MIKLSDVSPVYGNVYLTKKGVDERDLTKLRKLDGVRYRNIDQKWIDDNGDIYKEIDKYTGKKFWLQMNCKSMNAKGEFVENVDIKLLYPCGINTVPDQDIDHIREVDQEFMNIIIDLGIISGEDDPNYKRYSKVRATGVACLMTPGQTLKDMYGLAHYAFFSVVYDDFIGENKNDYTYAELSVMTAAIADIMNGKEVDMKKLREKIHDHEPEVKRDFFRKILKFVKLQYKDMDSHRHLGVDPIHYIKTYLQWIDSIHIEQCKEWPHELNNPELYKKGQQQLRLVTIAAIISLEMILYYKGVSIDQNIRDTFLFKFFYDLLCQQTCRMNDIMSFPKEYAFGDEGNVVMLHMRDGLSASEAIQKAAKECNDLTTQINQIGNLLLKVHKGNEQVVKVVENLWWTAHGHMQWYHYTPRYQPGMVCHCIVEDDE
ncbi:unnamed protein product [Orchesella dallaii]|uniref:Terpene synthase n=1 Tax=Orchesella dallaii TaxID=48710 RepID=A0ABP1S7X1_9HEXA